MSMVGTVVHWALVAALYLNIGLVLYWVKLDEYFKPLEAILAWPLIVFVGLVSAIAGFVQGFRDGYRDRHITK